MNIWKELTIEEEAEFRQWARDNYFQYSPDQRNAMWHPVVREEMEKIDNEYTYRAGEFDVANYYVVVEEYRGDFQAHFHVNDIFIVYEKDMMQYLSRIWNGKYAWDYVNEGVHQVSESTRYNIRRPRRIM